METRITMLRSVKVRGSATVINSGKNWQNSPLISVIFLCIHYLIRLILYSSTQISH
ncbi:unnamed protein product [Hymenolepis diminuta]|uniref:Uncharacterized protein n=1 Tax=Hymenolepis diminuta TaxID=6216 RepID=A0A564Z8X4_HYMDI|nr:unnamed protein product [Hymenolepis diminuta]